MIKHLNFKYQRLLRGDMVKAYVKSLDFHLILSYDKLTNKLQAYTLSSRPLKARRQTVNIRHEWIDLQEITLVSVISEGMGSLCKHVAKESSKLLLLEHVGY